MEKLKIGTYTVRKPLLVSESFECAAWSRSLRVAPGTYDAFVYLGPCDRAEGNLGHTVYVPVQGVVEHACFTPLFCGNPIGPDRTGPAEVGTVRKTSVKLSTCGLDSSVQSGDLSLDTALVVKVPYTSAAGKSYVFYQLRRAEVV